MDLPSIKDLPPGLLYYEFREAYQKLLYPYYPGKHFFHSKYGAYCQYHRKRNENEQQQSSIAEG